MIRFTTPDGYEVEADIRVSHPLRLVTEKPGRFVNVHIENVRVISGPPTPPSGGGEPLRRPA